jgi:two-component system invasion response regulator UvrY
VKLLIADDHPIVRQGLKQIVSSERDMTVAGEASNSAEVLELVRTGDFDVVLLDVSMPRRGGLDVLKDLKHAHPKLPVLILSIHAEDELVVRALRAGASGYVTKDSSPTELVVAIRKIARGGRYVSMALAEQLALDLSTGEERPLHERLSDREFEIMSLITSGKTVGQIAEELSLSVKTISTYRTRVMEKLKIHNDAELIRYALEHQLVT